VDWNTIIPVVVANVVTIIVAVLAWIQSNRALMESQHQHESAAAQARTLHDLDAVRGLLEDAALKLHKVSAAAAALSLGEGGAQLKAFEDSTVELDEWSARLEIRFEQDHEIVESFRSAESKAFELLWHAKAVSSKPPESWGRDFEGLAFSLEIDHLRRVFLSDAARWAGARLALPGA
jgi:hypothetical protein